MTARSTTLYVPDVLHEADLTRLFALVECYGFATLITATATGPLVSHVPLILDRDGGARGTLYGHVARANPHWMHLEGSRTVAVFTGPHAYVSPSWYAPSADNVPTWNYAVVHATGQPSLVRDGRATLEVLKRQVESYEAAGSTYAVDPQDPVLSRVSRGVVAFAIPVDEWVGKFKLSQTRPPSDRRSVADHLHASGDALARELAALMRRDA